MEQLQQVLVRDAISIRAELSVGLALILSWLALVAPARVVPLALPLLTRDNLAVIRVIVVCLGLVAEVGVGLLFCAEKSLDLGSLEVLIPLHVIEHGVVVVQLV